MKKIMYVLSALALAALCLSACKKDPQQDLDNAVEDGFYVAGAATGVTELAPQYMMTAGINENANQTKRDGMYEKYIVLDANKEFELLLYTAGKKTRYSAKLNSFTPEEGSTIYGEDPQMPIFKGVLETGDAAPAMKVGSKGLYHIVLDLNKASDLANAQIIVAPVEWGVRGAMNSWGFTKLEATELSNDGITYTLKNQDMAKNGEFKFAYGGAWKITLDDAGKIRANTNLGDAEEGLLSIAEGETKQGPALTAGGKNIKVDKGGLYDIELTFKLAAGELGKSYSYKIKFAKESTLPTEMYMIGAEFGGWNWADPGVVEMIPVNGQPGQFWTIRYFHKYEQGDNDKSNGFKFSPVKDWGKDFPTLGENVGTDALYNPAKSETNADLTGNNFVKEDGNYMVYIDVQNNKLCIEKAKVYGIGPAFDTWDSAKEDCLFVEEGTKLVGTAKKSVDGVTPANDPEGLRIYAESSIKTSDWWTREFVPISGAIAFRGNGGDQQRIAINAGQKVVLDFNAGTGIIQ